MQDFVSFWMFSGKKVLIIGTVWPEPESTAAGSRMMQLINFFKGAGANVFFVSAASNLEFSEDLQASGVQSQTIQANNSSFDGYIKSINPDLVLFDRFMMEEQFGWRVAEQCPDTIRILDTEDLHFLRNARHKASKTGKEVELFTDEARREISSMYRCDLSLIISTYEIELLTGFFKIDPSILHYVPFMMDTISKEDEHKLPAFEEREHFLSIGNFLHKPNWDAVRYLKENIWPLIREQLPNAEIHIYGAYASSKVKQLHKVKDGFLIKGRAQDAKFVLKKARVLLAPVRFGAGLKGKLAEAMQCGIPSVTTLIGAEGMHIKKEWSGTIKDNAEDFAESAVSLYQNRQKWKRAQQTGFELFNTLFYRKEHEKKLLEKLDVLLGDIQNHRKKNFMGSIFLQNTMQSYKYMSKWIEEKNKIDPGL